MNYQLLKNSVLGSQRILQNNVEKLKFLQPLGLIKKLENNKQTFVVQIGKNSQQLLNKSVWVGHRMGGMSTWLNAVMCHLPYKNFYLYVDTSKIDDHGVLEYYDGFYKRAFYKNYLGLCAGNRAQMPNQHMHQVQAITANNLLETIQNSSGTLLIDVRTPQQIKKTPVSNLPLGVQYRNLPVDHEELNEKFYEVFKNFDKRNQIITMCAKGYRGTIAYSLFRHFMKNSKYNMFVCQSSVQQINNALSQQKQAQTSISNI